MSDLADQKCVPCRGGVPPMAPSEVRRFLREIPGWDAPGDHHLLKRWTTTDFASALDLANRFGRIAEEQGHHPDLALGWGYVEAKVFTHKVDGLTLSDFVLAAKLTREAGGE